VTTTLHTFAAFKPCLEFRSPKLRARLQPVCNQVLQQFDQLPPFRLLCYFDDENPEWLQKQFGQFAGIHAPIIGGGAWPGYVEQYFFDRTRGENAFDNLIYIPGTAYAQKKIPFAITFSHELQHFAQWGFARKVYQANVLLFQNLLSFDPRTDAKIWDIPLNRDAMIISKRVAEALYGAEAVRKYMDAQIMESNNSHNISKSQLWTFFQNLSSSSSYDLRKQTDLLVQKYKQQLQSLDSKIDFSNPKWWL
jgi:hypothetical protein